MVPFPSTSRTTFTLASVSVTVRTFVRSKIVSLLLDLVDPALLGGKDHSDMIGDVEQVRPYQKSILLFQIRSAIFGRRGGVRLVVSEERAFAFGDRFYSSRRGVSKQFDVPDRLRFELTADTGSETLTQFNCSSTNQL